VAIMAYLLFLALPVCPGHVLLVHYRPCQLGTRAFSLKLPLLLPACLGLPAAGPTSFAGLLPAHAPDRVDQYASLGERSKPHCWGLLSHRWGRPAKCRAACLRPPASVRGGQRGSAGCSAPALPQDCGIGGICSPISPPLAPPLQSIGAFLWLLSPEGFSLRAPQPFSLQRARTRMVGQGSSRWHALCPAWRGCCRMACSWPPAWTCT
jgi:hypothetical protein